MSTRLAFYMPYLAVGGAEKSTLWLTQELKRRGHDVRFIVDRRGGPLDDAFSEVGPVRYLDAPRTALAGPALAKAVKEEAPDLLIAVMTHNILTAALMKRVGLIRAPLIGWEHAVLSSMRAARGVRGKVETKLIRALYPVCDKIICVSKGAAADAIELCAPNDINAAFAYNAVPSPKTAALSASEEALLARAGLLRWKWVGYCTTSRSHRGRPPMIRPT